MINTKLQNIIDTKSAIGNAINNKGGSITSETPFYEYAPAIENISTGGGAYSTWVVQDENGAKYQVHNGYDFVNNPTPNLANLPFNQWLLNNSATGDIVLENTIMSSGINFAGPNSSFNQANVPLVSNSGNIGVNYGSTPRSMKINNSFIYVGGPTINTVKKYHESNFAFVGNTASYGGNINALAINNGIIYVVGDFDRTIRSYYESNLVFINNSASYESYNFGRDIKSMVINNGFIFISGARTTEKYHESNLVYVANSTNNSTLGSITGEAGMTFNNGFIYRAGDGVRTGKLHESNLVLDGFINTLTRPWSVETYNGYLHIGIQTNVFIQKYHESNLVFDSNTTVPQIAGNISFNNGYAYVAGGVSGSYLQKRHADNLAFVANAANSSDYGTNIIAINNGFLYGFQGGASGNIIKYREAGISLSNESYYTINRVKE